MKDFMKVLFLLCIFYHVSCQYYELESEESEEESPEDSEVQEDIVIVNATQAITQTSSTNNSNIPLTLTIPTTSRTTQESSRVINQVNEVLKNVQILNITGIVDQSLGFRNNVPIRNMVNGIMSAIFCNRFFARPNNCGNK